MTEIPQEAIEAAAVVIASQFDTGPMPVDDTDRQYATEVLEAALPFLRSQWEQELRSSENCDRITRDLANRGFRLGGMFVVETVLGENT